MGVRVFRRPSGVSYGEDKGGTWDRGNPSTNGFVACSEGEPVLPRSVGSTGLADGWTILLNCILIVIIYIRSLTSTTSQLVCYIIRLPHEGSRFDSLLQDWVSIFLYVKKIRDFLTWFTQLLLRLNKSTQSDDLQFSRLLSNRFGCEPRSDHQNLALHNKHMSRTLETSQGLHLHFPAFLPFLSVEIYFRRDG